MHPTNVGRLALGIPGPVSCTPGGHRGAPRPLRGPGGRPGRRDRRAGRHDRPPAQHPAVAEAPHRQRRRHASCTPACPTGPSTRGGPTSWSPPPACPGMIQPEHIKPGGVVVGAGVRYEGRKLLPDVDEACEEVAGWITPRVGGVGPDHDRHALPQLRRGRRAPRRHRRDGRLPHRAPAAGRSRATSRRDSARRRPPDADHDPARRRAAPGPLGRRGPGGGGRLLRRAGRRSGTPAPRRQRDAVVADALDRGLPDDHGGDVCVELGSGIGAYTPSLASAVASGARHRGVARDAAAGSRRRRAPRAGRRRAAPARRRARPARSCS